MKISLGEYSQANSILDEVISYDLYDYDALVLKGDNYFKWAKTNSNYYKDSINSYTVALSKYGQKRKFYLNFSMLILKPIWILSLTMLIILLSQMKS